VRNWITVNLPWSVNSWAALVAAGLATTASAQPEQWLEYHTSREAKAYRWLEVTTNAPAGVALPKLNASPLFARWATPMDSAGGRWLCLDRTRKSGICDRLFIDSNGNGRLDDDPPANTAERTDSTAQFDAVRVRFKGEDGPIAYHLGFRFYKYSSGEERVLVESAGWYEGMIKIGDKKRRIELIDGNVNGAFNDQSMTPADCDRVVLDDDTAGQRYLGRMLEVDGQLFRLEVARDGAFVKVQKAEGIVFGQVRMSETITEFAAVGPNGHFVRKPVKGEFTLPVGQYRINRWEIGRKDDKGATCTLTGSGFNETANFSVAADQPAKVDIGEPVRGLLQTSEAAGEVTFNLRFQGRTGESIQMLRGGERPRGPRLTLASRDGAYRWTNSFEFG
jgi:hypothetical protein